jgi:hypothetical protein
MRFYRFHPIKQPHQRTREWLGADSGCCYYYSGPGSDTSRYRVLDVRDDIQPC